MEGKINVSIRLIDIARWVLGKFCEQFLGYTLSHITLYRLG